MTNQSTRKRVIHFINLIKGHKNSDGNDAHEILEQIYQNGNCYMFAKTLQFVFPEAIIYSHFVFGMHVIVKIGNHFYDIRGELKDGEEIIFKDYSPITEQEEKRASTWCYSHIHESAHGLHDENGDRITELQDLEVDMRKKSWKIPKTA